MPVRGAYLRLRSDRADLVRGNIYPVPDPALPALPRRAPDPPPRRSRAAGATALLSGTFAWPGTWRLAAGIGVTA